MSTQPYKPHYPEEIEDLKANAKAFREHLAKDKAMKEELSKRKYPPARNVEYTTPRRKPTIIFLALIATSAFSGCYIERGDRLGSGTTPPAIQITVSPDQAKLLREELLK